MGSMMSGTGVLITQSYVLSAAHILPYNTPLDAIVITGDEQKLSIVGVDRRRDLLLLKRLSSQMIPPVYIINTAAEGNELVSFSNLHGEGRFFKMYAVSQTRKRRGLNFIFTDDAAAGGQSGGGVFLKKYG
jgi:hypothetical protein